MTLILEMPSRGIASQEFEKDERDASASERGGRLGGVTLGFPLWSATFQLSPNLSRDMSDDWRAFYARLRGSKRPFLAYDRDRLFPRTYPDGFGSMTRVGGAAFDGSAASWSQAIDSDGEARVSLTDLPSGMVLVKGDYIGFRWDASGSPAGTHDRRTMARLVEPAVVAADGTVTALVEPPVPSAVPAGAEAHLDKPACIMRAVPGQAVLGPLDRRQKIAGGSLRALQDLRE